MSQSKKRKKKRAPGAPAAGAGDSALLRDGNGGKKMDPMARRILIFDVILVALVQLLDNRGVISGTTGDVLTILGVVLLVAAVALQARASAGGDRGGKTPGGPAGPHL